MALMNITAHRKVWVSIMLFLVLTSLALVGTIGFNLGLDFLGGIRWSIAFQTEQPVAQADLESFFAQEKSDGILTKTVQIQKAQNAEFLITMEGVSDQALKDISENMTAKVGKFQEKSFRRVDPSLGAHFQNKAYTAIGITLIGIMLVVGIAFRKVPKSVNPWRFGTVTIVALLHDVLVVSGVFVLLGKFMGTELDLQFITAILATLGLSVNDTIVVLDRVRENLRTQKAHETFEDTVEKSIQQTFRRSIITSVSVIIPLIVLLIFGAAPIFYFILALTVGIFIGTYSSIFVAAPLLVMWKNWVDNRTL